LAQSTELVNRSGKRLSDIRNYRIVFTMLSYSSTASLREQSNAFSRSVISRPAASFAPQCAHVRYSRIRPRTGSTCRPSSMRVFPLQTGHTTGADAGIYLRGLWIVAVCDSMITGSRIDVFGSRVAVSIGYFLCLPMLAPVLRRPTRKVNRLCFFPAHSTTRSHA